MKGWCEPSAAERGAQRPARLAPRPFSLASRTSPLQRRVRPHSADRQAPRPPRYGGPQSPGRPRPPTDRRAPGCTAHTGGDGPGAAEGRWDRGPLGPAATPWGRPRIRTPRSKRSASRSRLRPDLNSVDERACDNTSNVRITPARRNLVPGITPCHADDRAFLDHTPARSRKTGVKAGYIRARSRRLRARGLTPVVQDHDELVARPEGSALAGVQARDGVAHIPGRNTHREAQAARQRGDRPRGLPRPFHRGDDDQPARAGPDGPPQAGQAAAQAAHGPPPSSGAPGHRSSRIT
jgi:hypothetical protein